MAETAIIETKPAKIPIHFELGEKLIDSATIRPSTFASFAECIGAAHRMTQPAAFSARLLRVRMSKQVNYHVNGAVIPLSRNRCCGCRCRIFIASSPRSTATKVSPARSCATATASIRPETPLWSLWLALS